MKTSDIQRIQEAGRTFIHDGTRTDQYATGLVFGDEGAVYVSAVQDQKHTTVIKLVVRRSRQ